MNSDDIKNKKLVKPGDLVITVSGRSPMKGATNMLKISKFGDPATIAP